MLVFFSDIHLTDGTTGDTVSPAAFDLFINRVAALARKRKARRIWCVLLGDGLDVIRSGRWSEPKGCPKPWDPPGPGQEATVHAVLDGILRQNREAIEALRRMPERIARKRRINPTNVRFDYLLGNHDWPINRYRSTRERVVQAIGLDPAFIDAGFPLEFPWEGVRDLAAPYDVLARHGDVYDLLNYDLDAGRDASSVGDAIVIELLDRLPEEIGRELGGHPSRDRIVARLREVHNVRPLGVIPEWLVGAVEAEGSDDPAVVRGIHRAVRRSVDRFRASKVYTDFVRRHLWWWERFYLTRVLYSLRRQEVSWVAKKAGRIVRFASALKSFRRPSAAKYAARALEERFHDGSKPRCIVYGHTHVAETLPLGLANGGAERYYLNTGTWCRIWQRGWASEDDPHFAGWKVMTYAVIYSGGEREGECSFETWRGELRENGDPRDPAT